jgi:hypothetical protein
MAALAAAAWANEPIWPAGAAQKRPAMFFIRELVLKLNERTRELHSDFLLEARNTRPS